MKVFPFQPEDLETICEIERKNIRKEIAIPKEQLCAILVHPDAVSYCLKKDDKITGYIVLRIEKIRGWMDIISMVVEKKYRRKSWGKKLIFFSQEISKAIKLDFLIVQVDKKNKVAVSFFKNLGFKITKEFDDYLVEKEKGYEMQLDLKPTD